VPRKIGAEQAGLCEQAKRNRKNQPRHDHHITTGSTMVIDSSGTCDGERRMTVGNALGDCG
jgi:hypothetical protein